MSGVRHPAKFTPVILDRAVAILNSRFLPPWVLNAPRVLDPFAGTGRGVDVLRFHGYDAVGTELEPEWASMSPHVVQGNALALPFADDTFDAVFTSPCYGNRMADSHKAKDKCKKCRGRGVIDNPDMLDATDDGPGAMVCPYCHGEGLSRRNTYTHALGRKLTDGNAGAMQWGPEYRALHIAAWTEAARVLAPGGLLLLNLKDFIRKGQRVFVSEWHFLAALKIGFVPALTVHVPTPGNRQGANGDARVDGETLMLFAWEPEKPVLQSELITSTKGTST